MFTKRHSTTLVVIAAVLMLLAVGCATPVVLPTPGHATIPFPIGVFRDTSTSIGKTLEFRAGGTFSFRGAEYEDSYYTVKGDQIRFSGGRCAIISGDGVYQWAYDGKVLTFKMLADSCGGRSVPLQGGEFTKTSAFMDSPRLK
jgi:hypothetical protein